MSRPTAIVSGSNCFDVGAADRVAPVLVDIGPVDTADVVGFEDLRIQHVRDGKCPPIRSYT